MKTAITQFIKETGTGVYFDQTDRNPNMDDMPIGSRHYIVTITNGCGDQMAAFYSMGSGLKELPKAEDVLACLAMDASYGEMDIDEFYRELGYDSVSKALKALKACKQTADDLNRLYSPEELEQLQEASQNW